VYRARRIFLEAESSRKIPDELKDARVALGSDRFAKEALSIQGDLGEITDFEQSRNGELMVVGQNGVVFLNNGNSFQRSFHFQKKCNSPISNKLVASDKDFIYVLATDGKTLARLPAPASATLAQPRERGYVSRKMGHILPDFCAITCGTAPYSTSTIAKTN